MAEAVYILCALTSLLCAWVLLRAYARCRPGKPVRLLLWSGVCFAGLATNNVLLVVDKVLTGPEVDLSLWRSMAALIALGVMLYGLVWDAE